jgi:hypothetical protein
VNHTFRICPNNKEIIEWRADLDGARWCFFKRCDSPNDAKRILSILRGDVKEDPAQMELAEAA